MMSTESQRIGSKWMTSQLQQQSTVSNSIWWIQSALSWYVLLRLFLRLMCIIGTQLYRWGTVILWILYLSACMVTFLSHNTLRMILRLLLAKRSKSNYALKLEICCTSTQKGALEKAWAHHLKEAGFAQGLIPKFQESTSFEREILIPLSCRL